MKVLRIFLTVLIMGALWGAVELSPLPTYLYISAGILFLTISRTLLNKAGSSLIIGFIVCALKTANCACTFTAVWGGIIAIAFSFDLLATLFWKEEYWSVIKSSILGFAGAIIAAPLFIVWAIWVAGEPRWVGGGLSEAMGYITTTGLYGALCSIIAAPAGYLLGTFLKRWYPAANKVISHS